MKIVFVPLLQLEGWYKQMILSEIYYYLNVSIFKKEI